MTMPWLKLYHEARTDPKLRAISRDQHYVWFNILCFANEQPERGVIKVDDEEVLACAVADGDVDLLRSSLERLTKLRLVDRSEDTISPHGWGDRQGKVDATSAERAKRYRERHKSSSGKRKNASRVTERDATRDERVRERDVTDRHAAVTEKSRPDRDEEREKRNPPPTPEGEASKPTQDSREPISIEAEPFDSGQTDPLPESVTPPKPAVVNDPAEVARLVLKAESIFRANFDVGMSVREAARKIKADWIDEALDIARENNATGWGFVRSVLSRFKAQGMTDSEKQAAEWKKKQETRLWSEPSHVPEPDPRRPKNMRSKNALSESEILEFQRGVA